MRPLSPLNGSTYIPVDNQIFTWSPYANAQSYIMEYSTNANFTGNTFVQQVTSTSTSLQGLSPLTTYYWRVRAINGVDMSPWSTSWSFTTQNCSITIADAVENTICESELHHAEIRLYDLCGKEVMKASVQGTSTILNLSSVAKGIYILRVFEDGRIYQEAKIIKE